MLTLNLLSRSPNITWAAKTVTAAGAGTPASAQHNGLGLLALIVAAALLVLALRHLRRALLPIAELLRMVTAASLVAVLVLAAFVLVVMSVVVRG